jgi:hypothetical protein
MLLVMGCVVPLLYLPVTCRLCVAVAPFWHMSVAIDGVIVSE